MCINMQFLWIYQNLLWNLEITSLEDGGERERQKERKYQATKSPLWSPRKASRSSLAWVWCFPLQTRTTMYSWMEKIEDKDMSTRSWFYQFQGLSTFNKGLVLDNLDNRNRSRFSKYKNEKPIRWFVKYLEIRHQGYCNKSAKAREREREEHTGRTSSS